MSTVKIIGGNLHIVFNDSDEPAVVYKLDNGAELEFNNDTLSALILPNFERQLNIGDLSNIDIALLDIQMQDSVILFTLDIQGQHINGRVDCSSMQ